MNFTVPAAGHEKPVDQPAPLPTFDEWFEATHGTTFDCEYMQAYHDSTVALRALVRGVRDYSTWVAQQTWQRGRP